MKFSRKKDLEHCLLARDAGSETRLIRILAELRKGFAFLDTFACDQVVTFFGSARLKETSPYYKKARRLGRVLAKHGMTIITGGGPGIMEAGNRGASEGNNGKGRSVGINIFLAGGERRNKFVKESVGFRYFFNRKVMLAYSAESYVFFPGGYGTLDEFFEICNLVITKKITKKIPIVLMGKSYWNPLNKWMKKELAKKLGTLNEKDLKIFTITDSVSHAASIIRKCPTEIPRSDEI